jgi:pyruvate,water dikinase
MTDLRTFEQIGPGDADAVGGKGLSLGRLAGAGLPVPAGFCVTTAAYRRLRGRPPEMGSDFVRQLHEAYQRLGGGPVAVRSSATAEDGAVTSFAGQQETFLGVTGADAVCVAVARCWASLDSERAAAYRRRQGVSADGLAMAVVVQRLVHAEVAGVLFTRDPLDAEGRRMLVEAAWGLGEGVVSGRVSPDRYHLDRQSGCVLERHVGMKAVEVTADGEREVPAERQHLPCLDDARLAELAELGRRVEALYGEARDVEWAWAEGRFWLLQARPITAADAADRALARHHEIVNLVGRAEPGGTVWSRFNVPEGMPEPTSMTWALVDRLLSGRGGCGLMYRDIGYGRQASAAEESVYDLIAGRVYCNLSREARRHPGWLPVEYPFAALKADPLQALAPRPVRDPSRAGPLFWLLLPLRLPFLTAAAVRRVVRLGALSAGFADHFRQEVLPAFTAEVDRAAADDWSQLDTPALLERFNYWVRRTLDEFARDSLKPTALATVARAGLEGWLRRKLGPERARAALGELSMGVKPDPEADLTGALRDLAAGRLGREEFLKRFGHRGSQDMELAQPRWAEDPSALDHLPAPAEALAGDEPAQRWEKVAAEAGLSALERAALDPQVRALHTYLGLRETAKHHFMRGYALIRRALVELDCRHRLNGGVFFLTPDELPRLVQGEDFAALVAERRRWRAAMLSLELPPVLFSDDLEAIGRPLPVEGADTLQGLPLSAGAAEGPALVLSEPRTDGLPAEPYVLVCPSTDPAWVPLFARARGLVMEVGGVLSHGAIVAREYGLPAVAGIPGVQKRLRTGQRLRVDGARGTVTVLPG